MNKLREVRNKFLQDSDWTQLPDAPLTQLQKSAWAIYRQILRDLPNSYESIEEALDHFPTRPE